MQALGAVLSTCQRRQCRSWGACRYGSSDCFVFDSFNRLLIKGLIGFLCKKQRKAKAGLQAGAFPCLYEKLQNASPYQTVMQASSTRARGVPSMAAMKTGVNR